MQQSSTQVQIQKLLLTQKTFKRNKRYFDIPKVINIQKTYEIKRRMPKQFYDQHLQKRLNKSFQSSQVQLNYRLDQDIQKFKGRISPTKNTAYTTSMSFYPQSSNKQFQPQQQLSTESISPQKSPRNIRGVPHISMTSRDYFYKKQNKPIIDERLFQNFKLQKSDQAHTKSFSKMRGRSMNFQHKHMNDIYHDTQKLYQKNNYKRTTESCKFNYKLQKPISRYFFNKRRQGSDASTDLNPEKVKKSFDYATNFDNFKASTFYFESGRQLPHQIQLRDMTPLRDYWRGNERFVIRPKPDYFHSKLKDLMIDQRMQEIKRKRMNGIDRNQICDDKYFKMIGSKNRKPEPIQADLNYQVQLQPQQQQ